MDVGPEVHKKTTTTRKVLVVLAYHVYIVIIFYDSLRLLVSTPLESIVGRAELFPWFLKIGYYIKEIEQALRRTGKWIIPSDIRDIFSENYGYTTVQINNRGQVFNQVVTRQSNAYRSKCQLIWLDSVLSWRLSSGSQCVDLPVQKPRTRPHYQSRIGSLHCHFRCRIDSTKSCNRRFPHSERLQRHAENKSIKKCTE